MHIFRFRTAIWLFALGFAGCTDAASVEGPQDEPQAGSAPRPFKVMDEEQRQFIWQIEHHGNVLNRVGFPALAGALKSSDERALAAMLASDFDGELPTQPKEVRLKTEFVDVVRQTDAGAPPTK